MNWLFNTLPVPSVWSTEGPVCPEEVGPEARVQSNLSSLAWFQLQNPLSKVQSSGEGGTGLKVINKQCDRDYTWQTIITNI